MAHSRHPRPTRLGAVGGALLALGLTAACTSAGPRHADAVPAPHPAAAAVTPGAATTTPGTTTPGTTAPAPPKEATCSYRPSTAALPTWARSGFRAPYDGWKYVTSKTGQIVAVLFGDPLRAGTPGPTQAQNKILWVPDDPSAGALTVDGHLVGTNTNADIGDISFGPSYVNVPTAGCWRFTLHWIGGTDSIDIVYGKA
jgi:hypothetical protein